MARQRRDVGFDQIANLFLRAPLMPAICTMAQGWQAGSRMNAGQWNTAGHRDRIVRVDDAALGCLRPALRRTRHAARRARLPALHAGQLNSVLAKLAAYPRRLADLGDDYFSTEMWHETMQQK